MLRSFFIGVTRTSLRFKWITIGIVVLLIALGVYSASKMNQELLPPLEFPQTFVFTLQPGASSEDLRDLVTIPLEKEFTALEGVIPAGLETTTVSPVSVMIVRYEYGINSDALKTKMQASIDKVVSEGVPAGLKTTADLTPDLVTRVLKRAPSMWDHFDATQLQAMSPAVLDAAFKVNPDFAAKLDPLTRDQLAARRVDSTLNPTGTTTTPVALPSAWALTKDALPQIKTFSLADLPVLTASIYSPNVSPDQLRGLVNDQLVAALKAEPQIGNVSVSGGQTIPQDVLDAAKLAVDKQNAAPQAANGVNSAAAATPAPTAVATSAATDSGTSPTDLATVARKVIIVPLSGSPQAADVAPKLPASWNGPLGGALILRQYFNAPAIFNTAADLLGATDKTGNKLTAAQTLNIIAQKSGYLLRDLSPDVINYLKGQEADLGKNLLPVSLQNLTAESYAALTGEKVAPALTGSAWTQLQNQPGFKALSLVTVRDLLKLKGGAAAGLNAIVANTPADLQAFAIHLISSLTPDGIAYLSDHEPGFLTNLQPAVLKYFSADVITSLPDAFYTDLKTKDATTYSALQAIKADPSKSAVAQLKEPAPTQAIPDDPKAPLLPTSWAVLKGFGVNATKADDLLRNPFGQKSAADFLNLIAAGQGASLMKDLTPDVLLYLDAHETGFLANLKAATLAAMSKDTLAKLPQDAQDRAASAVTFIATNTITRTNGAPSLTVGINKTSDANTVVVSDAIDEVFQQIQQKNADKQLGISPIFEQASFIRESISGVAREGGLGALMAIIVILLFLNFSIRSTAVTAVSIPTSVAIAFILMHYVPGAVHTQLLNMVPAGAQPSGVIGFFLRLFPATITLNIMTLSGLTVAIGRVVDDSIVVLENIYRQIQTGKDPLEAVLTGTGDVSIAIFAATLTTVVVFLPIGLTGGVIGDFFLPFGLAVTYALIASFIVAITIVPVMAFLLISRKNVPDEKEGVLERIYHGLIIWALDHRWVVLAGALATLVLGFYLFGTRPQTFLPSFGEVSITVSVSMPAGTPIAQTDVRVSQMEDYLKGLKASGSVRTYQVLIGSGGGLAAFVGGSGVDGTAAQITVAVNVKDDALAALTTDIRAKSETIFGSSKNVKVSKGSLSDSGFGGFAVVISGPKDELDKLNDAVKAKLATVPGLTNITSTLDQVSAATSKTYLRIGQTDAVQFSGELETQDTLGVTTQALAAVKAMGLPAGLTVGQGFQSQQQTEGFASTIGSLGIAIIIVYLVMVITFGSLIQPFTILFSLPMAVVGAALGLTLTNRVLGISALIGLLMLIGIVVTNAIVLLDRVQANRKHGMSAHDALVEGGRTRLRPILMTAIATMIALVPLAIGVSQGAIIASELGTVVIGGLFSSTALTLLVVPVVYSLFDQAQKAIFRRGDAKKSQS